MTQSRTSNSIKNSSVALVMYFINLILQFWSRKIFLDYLGTEILGLNTTATNILQFLNLAELGVWTAIATSLYKPLSENNQYEINRIMTFNGHIYKRIAWLIIAASAVTMCFFPVIFDKMELPLWYAYASFGVLLFSSLLTYFLNYKQFLLSADQKEYKIQLSYKINMSIKVLAQIFAISCLENPYIWWLILEVIFAISGSLFLQRTIKKTYPFLKNTSDTFNDLKKLYPEIITRVKQLFFQKISGYVLFQVSPLIIYALYSLDLVTLYGNYMLIIMGMISVMAAIFNGMLGSIGNLIASSSKLHIIDIFFQLFTLRFYIIMILTYGIWLFGQQFIILWIGSQYLLSEVTLAILALTFFVYVNRYIVYDYLSAYGYFEDVWASIAEVLINIGLSVVLGLIYGLNGILSGVLISLFVISILWKPYFLFRIKLKYGFKQYWVQLFFHCIVSFIIIVFLHLIADNIPRLHFKNIELPILQFVLFTILLVLCQFFLFKSFRDVVHRFIIKFA